jgi:hypothetical protein
MMSLRRQRALHPKAACPRAVWVAWAAAWVACPPEWATTNLFSLSFFFKFFVLVMYLRYFFIQSEMNESKKMQRRIC